MMCFLSDVRTLDPDNDHRKQIPQRIDFTNNYVRYQKGYPDYEHPTIPNAALVCACGDIDFNAIVCLGAVHPLASVRIGGLPIDRASVIIRGLHARTWLNFGGKDVLNNVHFKSRMSFADECIHVMFQLGDLAPGESTTISTGHIMKPTEVTAAFNTLGALNIIQPNDLMTGPSVAFTVGIYHVLNRQLLMRSVSPSTITKRYINYICYPILHRHQRVFLYAILQLLLVRHPPRRNPIIAVDACRHEQQINVLSECLDSRPTRRPVSPVLHRQCELDSI